MKIRFFIILVLMAGFNGQLQADDLSKLESVDYYRVELGDVSFLMDPERSEVGDRSIYYNMDGRAGTLEQPHGRKIKPEEPWMSGSTLYRAEVFPSYFDAMERLYQVQAYLILWLGDSLHSLQISMEPRGSKFFRPGLVASFRNDPPYKERLREIYDSGILKKLWIPEGIFGKAFSRIDQLRFGPFASDKSLSPQAAFLKLLFPDLQILSLTEGEKRSPFLRLQMQKAPSQIEMHTRVRELLIKMADEPGKNPLQLCAKELSRLNTFKTLDFTESQL